ncbi:right-handed parallel beta-helix repeat-containing protein [Tundrisphaera lichenicola]|uniref:right-handed parallel beta-helix repeat-containing protein n=1 Tax=Tundrisphaera lichenicola TaxID=2029860 RepID=UPI003EB7921F
MRSIRSILGASLLALVVMIAPRGEASDLHVAPRGNDGHPGTEAQPLATLSGAARAARSVTKPVKILVHAGTYYLPEPLVLTAEDSGVTWLAAPDESVVISGGAKLDLRWEPYRDGIVRAKTPEGLAFDQLFVDGRRQLMARYPNYNPEIRPYGGFAADSFGRERASRWADPAGGYIHAMHRAEWGGYHYKITGKDAQGEVVYEGGWQNNRQMGMHPRWRFVENIFEELDAPGEWFHDPKTTTLYYKPAEGVDLSKSTVEVVRLRHLVELRGTPENPVRDVTLRGFLFRHAARTFMDVKEPLLRSDWTIYRGGAVLFNGTEDCSVEDAEFDQLGGNAVFVNEYNRRITIRGCDIHDTGASAIAFVGDPKTVRDPLFHYDQRQSFTDISKTPGPQGINYPADCLVDDCLIRKVGVVEKQATGVEISMSLGITVRHCSIYETSRAGINVSEGTFGGHVVEFCDVFDTVLETGDHGSFNSWGRDRFWGLKDVPEVALADLSRLDMVRPNILRNNRWRCDHGWDVDLDDGSSNYEIYNNLFLSGGLKLREGFHRKVWNNITVNNSLHPHVWFEDSDDEITRNIWMGAYRPAAMSPTLRKWGKEVDRNLFTTTEADRTKFADKGCDLHSIVGDPMFVDPTLGDFRVEDGSPALAIGFRNFPMDQFGVRKPSLKALARTPRITPPASTDPAPSADGRYTWRGATLRAISGEEYSAFGTTREQGGLAILEVAPGSPADRDGFRPDDLILQVDGRATVAMKDFLAICGDTTKPGPVIVKLSRGQHPQQLTIEGPLTAPTRPK